MPPRWLRCARPCRLISASRNLSAVQTQMTVTADSTLLDRHQPTLVHRLGSDTLQQRTTALPGRVLPDLVNTQPGWLLEANGILHPRRSEYQTQYVVDGLPMTDNRSPVFAPEPGADDIHSMSIMTGGYPAEYGRKLGGVIEVVTASSARRGFGSSMSASVGSFDTGSGEAIVEHGSEKRTISVTAAAATTDRYLDPPVADNFTNHASTASASMRFERDVSPSSRVAVILRHASSRFLVPNENIQQEAGQRQELTDAAHERIAEGGGQVFPLAEVELRLGAVDMAVPERDRKAHGTRGRTTPERPDPVRATRLQRVAG
jgi:hypothetical protein